MWLTSWSLVLLIACWFIWLVVSGVVGLVRCCRSSQVFAGRSVVDQPGQYGHCFQKHFLFLGGDLLVQGTGQPFLLFLAEAFDVCFACGRKREVHFSFVVL